MQTCPEYRERCRLPYATTPYRFINTIDAYLPHGIKFALIGVAVIVPERRALRVTIMTIEGLLIFDAALQESMSTVYRALPPFDGYDFRRALLSDVRFLLLPPEGEPKQYGILKNGANFCKYEQNEGTSIEIVVNRDTSWELHEYKNDKTIRTAKGTGPANGLNDTIILKGFLPKPYRLEMKSIRVEPASPHDAE